VLSRKHGRNSRGFDGRTWEGEARGDLNVAARVEAVQLVDNLQHGALHLIVTPYRDIG